jgi:hypothetical protein
VQVAHELGISLPTDDEEVGLFGKQSNFNPRPALLKAVAESFGKESFESPQLVEEALTHPSAVYQDVSSYQRLEWVGDAVLCLAMREWIYFQYPEKEVGDLVNLESALVSNETLAYLSFQNGLHTFLNHRDQGLPLRLEHYEWCVKELGRGLWGTGESHYLGITILFCHLIDTLTLYSTFILSFKTHQKSFLMSSRLSWGQLTWMVASKTARMQR